MSQFLPPGVGAGALPDPFDGRDRYYEPSPNTTAKPSVDLKLTQLTIYNQGGTNSCTANAAALAFWYEEKTRGDPTWGIKGPSRRFIYWAGRGGWDASNGHNINGVTDIGCFPRMAMNGIAKCGACPEDDFPFPDISSSNDHLIADINQKPADNAFSKAQTHTINSYYRLDADRPLSHDDQLSISDKDKLGADLLKKLRLCLTEGFPVCFSLYFSVAGDDSWDWSSIPYVLLDQWKIKGTAPHTYSHDNKGHTVIAVGYDDSRQQVLAQNSWGGVGHWGNGLFWMPYSWVTDFYATVDYWTVRINQSVAPNAPQKTWQQVQAEILGHS